MAVSYTEKGRKMTEDWILRVIVRNYFEACKIYGAEKVHEIYKDIDITTEEIPEKGHPVMKNVLDPDDVAKTLYDAFEQVGAAYSEEFIKELKSKEKNEPEIPIVENAEIKVSEDKSSQKFCTDSHLLKRKNGKYICESCDYEVNFNWEEITKEQVINAHKKINEDRLAEIENLAESASAACHDWIEKNQHLESDAIDKLQQQLVGEAQSILNFYRKKEGISLSDFTYNLALISDRLRDTIEVRKKWGI